MESIDACPRDGDVADVITCNVKRAPRAVPTMLRKAEKSQPLFVEYAAGFGLISSACSGDVSQVDPQPSLLSEYVFFPTYDKVVTYYPTSWTPNGVTIVGVSMTLLSSLLLLVSIPMTTIFASPLTPRLWPHSVAAPSNLRLIRTWSTRMIVMNVHERATAPLYPLPTQHALHRFYCTPSALLILCGVLNLIYCFADNTDGRLARRLRKSSFVGEYLDHGLDCVTSLLSTFLALSVVGVSMPSACVASFVVAFTTVLSHTLNYESNVFIWGGRLASVDEAMVLLGVAMWVPVMFPSVGSCSIADLLLGGPVLLPWCGHMLNTFTVADAAYVVLCLVNMHTMATITHHNVYMLLRAHVLAMAANLLVLVVGMTIHSDHVLQIRASRDNRQEMGLVEQSYVPGYMWGPFSYTALWVIIFACTSSVIVHIPIAAKCARLPRMNVAPIVGVVIIWVIFVYWPVLAALAAVALHVVQILYNLQLIHRNRSREHALQRSRDGK